ncbi:ATPase, T2SS/T4P/T4SS family [Methanococcus aeolicus]|nr:ATPase, T2SS/T4P/T4SS family [Methanococcus aeolicus]UXM85581.1 ATPase, T2SS/T4P/T4SS family [Methanococcus aeolicus]
MGDESYGEKEIIDSYEVTVDGAPFDIVLEKINGVIYYAVPEMDSLDKIWDKFSIEILDNLKNELSSKIFEDIKNLREYLSEFCERYNIILKKEEIESLSKYYYLSLGKLGLIEIPLHDSNLEELMVNGNSAPTFVAHRKYDMCETHMKLDNNELMRVVEGIAMLANRTIDSRTPMLDAFLPDGSRVNATTPDVTLNGVTLTIRKFSEDPLTIVDLIKFGTFNIELAAFLWQAVEGYFGSKPANTLIAGGTGSGKTTTLNVVSLFSMYTDRIITVEDTPELQIPHKHVVKMITRPARPGIEGYEVTMNDLIKNTLRMRPDRIFVGEVRGPEAQSLLTAMNTGHDGCSGTLHANSADEAISRLINPPMSVPKIMVGALDFIINQQRIKRNRKTIRRILSIMEIGGEGENITKTELFKYDGMNDEIVKTGICMWEEEVCRIAGIDRTELIKDRIDREEVLKYMINNNINGIKNVGKIILSYQENPEKVMSKIG